MTYRVAWGGGVGGATISTAAELDAVLAAVGLTSTGRPYNVSIIATDIPGASTIPPMVDICIGHPQRSYVYHVGADGSSAWGFEPDLEPMAEVYVDYGGVVSESWPERVRVSPAAARCAAREFVAGNAQRPTCLSWDTDEE